MTGGGAIKGLVVPGLPHPLLAADRNEGWMRIRRGFEAARDEVRAAGADLLLVYSTMWPSIIGHQIQADPQPEWVHVDELFHDLGSIPYTFRIDASYAEAFCGAAGRRGLQARTVAYHGFPIDTGSVVALKLLNPENELPACIVSSNVYSDRAETVVLGKAAADALREQGKRAIAVVVTSLSNRLFTEFIDPAEDRIHSAKDDEWNQKMLEFLADGRLEDVSQLSREMHRQVRVKKVVNFKPMWWLAAVLGQHNAYDGRVHAYAPVYGAGAAVVSLTPSRTGVGDREFDEEDVEIFTGDRTVLAREPGLPRQDPAPLAGSSKASATAATATGVMAGAEAPAGAGPTAAAAARAPAGHPAPAPIIETDAAPKPVGAYPHARRVGDFLYLSGIGPRRPQTGDIPGGPVRDAEGNPLDYDIAAQTRSVIANVRSVLGACGAAIEDVVDVTVFLTDMHRDFEVFNRIYAEHFAQVRATRTTVEVRALPTPIAVELKVVARVPS